MCVKGRGVGEYMSGYVEEEGESFSQENTTPPTLFQSTMYLCGCLDVMRECYNFIPFLTSNYPPQSQCA